MPKCSVVATPPLAITTLAAGADVESAGQTGTRHLRIRAKPACSPFAQMACYHPSNWGTKKQPQTALNRSRSCLDGHVFARLPWVSQQTHNKTGGRGVQDRKHMVVFYVVCRDSPEVELCLHVLEPRLWFMLPKIRKLDCGRIDRWAKGLSRQSH